MMHVTQVNGGGGGAGQGEARAWGLLGCRLPLCDWTGRHSADRPVGS